MPPPLKDHVIIYFMEEGASENLAIEFFQYFSKSEWRNCKHKPLLNWKTAAWEWILNKVFERWLF